MRLLAVLAGAVAVLAVPVAARALPEGGIEAVNERDASVPVNCGYVYSSTGLRGTQYPLVHEPGYAFPNLHSESAIIGHGCTCAFVEDKDCVHGRVHHTGMMQGNLPFPANCVGCWYSKQASSEARDTQPATQPGAVEKTCGTGYSSTGLAGWHVPLITDTNIYEPIRSAEVTRGYVCEFFQNEDCKHRDGTADWFISPHGFKGNLPGWSAKCTFCYDYLKAAEARPIAGRAIGDVNAQ